MKLTITLLVTLGLFAYPILGNSVPKTFTEASDEPAFVKSFNQLHRAPPVPLTRSTRAVSTEWIEQKVDNFNDADTRTWQMRYMSNDEFLQNGSPIFIYLGGEWAISSPMITGGHFYDLAKEHNGMLYYTEHRYYGESKPTSDISTDSLEFLHVRQALADVAHFIRQKRETVPQLANSKVILAGGSYSATMVVWFKRLYPELMAGGFASSAPLLAKVNFFEYKETVGDALRDLGSQACYNRVQNGVAGFEQMFANNQAAEVKSMLRICNNFDEKNDLDIWSLFGSISNIFSGIVQYQSEGDIPIYCNFLMSLDDDDVSALGKFVLWYYGYPTTCLDYSYKGTVEYYRDNTYVYGASRPWYFQTCNEYGWYQTSSSSQQPFGSKFPVTLYTTLCADVFGPHFTSSQIDTNVATTNGFFGGMNPEVENVYQTHGGYDPWSRVGHGEAQGATVIPGASHCADFGSISSSDTAEMRASKERLAELVREWLA